MAEWELVTPDTEGRLFALIEAPLFVQEKIEGLLVGAAAEIATELEGELQLVDRAVDRARDEAARGAGDAFALGQESDDLLTSVPLLGVESELDELQGALSGADFGSVVSGTMPEIPEPADRPDEIDISESLQIEVPDVRTVPTPLIGERPGGGRYGPEEEREDRRGPRGPRPGEPAPGEGFPGEPPPEEPPPEPRPEREERGV